MSNDRCTSVNVHSTHVSLFVLRERLVAPEVSGCTRPVAAGRRIEGHTSFSAPAAGASFATRGWRERNQASHFKTSPAHSARHYWAAAACLRQGALKLRVGPAGLENSVLPGRGVDERSLGSTGCLQPTAAGYSCNLSDRTAAEVTIQCVVLVNGKMLRTAISYSATLSIFQILLCLRIFTDHQTKRLIRVVYSTCLKKFVQINCVLLCTTSLSREN